MTDGIFSNYNGSSVFTEINTRVIKRNGTLKIESHVRESQRERWESVSVCLCIPVSIMTCPVVSNSKVDYCLFGVNYLMNMNENGKVKIFSCSFNHTVGFSISSSSYNCLMDNYQFGGTVH